MFRVRKRNTVKVRVRIRVKVKVWKRGTIKGSKGVMEQKEDTVKMGERVG